MVWYGKKIILTFNNDKCTPRNLVIYLNNSQFSCFKKICFFIYIDEIINFKKNTNFVRFILPFYYTMHIDRIISSYYTRYP
jgi:hypothetical protein